MFNDDAVGNAVYEMCEVLYDAAGKCNRYLDVANTDETYDVSLHSKLTYVLHYVSMDPFPHVG